ncbi:hypothetical protein BKA59DRAFT_523650 [Fusarium tricinctum]|uniref:Uncharacterized protein n=1 Tax=Fusarium tricinctum TaxID=61284 RepID=A0A8K0WC48_9HYPO|nr:hypothetical protein BKA59DRAFT_523650 [Fusarium tricinctum]
MSQFSLPETDEDGILKVAVTSSLESASPSSDDERTPGIQDCKLEKLKDLGTMGSQFAWAKGPYLPLVAQKMNTMCRPSWSSSHSLCASSLDDMHERKRSHVCSATEPNRPLLQSIDGSVTVSKDEMDEHLKTKPRIVRKKSGEIVRPVLRPSSSRRHSSIPGTHIFSKAVHFDSQLEDVRHFLPVDRPLAISKRLSPADNYKSDSSE